MSLFYLLLVGLLASLSRAADETIVAGSSGAAVVEATVSKIESACIFPDDKLFMRRLSYVESYDGADPKTFRTGYYGGIWQVDKVMFDLTQDSTTQSFLSSYIKGIQMSFAITWSQVKWEDLTKPLYSALASRLYIEYKSRGETEGIPRAMNDQGNFWVKYYRPASSPSEYVNKASKLENSCISNGADIVFLFDGSGSITYPNFDKMKKFAKDVVNSFDVGFGATQTRFGLIQYSNNAIAEFNLKSYSNNTSINAAIDRVYYQNGNTNTHLGLEMMRTYSFLESSGARPISQNHPRIGIVLTDGASNKPADTIVSAQAAQAAGINLIAVGIGTNLNMAELKAIASDPDCLNLILLNNGFTDIDSLHYIVEKRSCDAPVGIEPGDNSTIELPPGGDQNCKINITKDGVTIEIVALNDATTNFYVSRSGYPSESYFEDSVEASAGHVGLMFIENKLKNGSLDSIFCNIKAGNISSNISIGCKPGDGDTCKNTKPCLNNGSCENQPGSSYSCACPSDYTGNNCESMIDVCGNSKPCLNNGICENQPAGSYVCTCSSHFTGINCESKIDSGLYNCEDRNPCTQENINNGKLFFPNDDPSKYVQCSNWGQCYVMSCPAGTIWNQAVFACDHAI